MTLNREYMYVLPVHSMSVNCPAVFRMCSPNLSWGGCKSCCWFLVVQVLGDMVSVPGVWTCLLQPSDSASPAADLHDHTRWIHRSPWGHVTGEICPIPARDTSYSSRYLATVCLSLDSTYFFFFRDYGRPVATGMLAELDIMFCRWCLSLLFFFSDDCCQTTCSTMPQIL